MPPVADVESIAKTLGSILAGKAQSHGALTVIPILAPMQAVKRCPWRTLPVVSYPVAGHRSMGQEVQRVWVAAGR